MTRGKYATRAEKTRAVTTAMSELEAGRAAIVRLSAENKRLRSLLQEVQDANRERVRVLDAQVREGTSAEVRALRLELQAARDEAAAERQRAKGTSDSWAKAYKGMTGWLIDRGLPYIEVTELMLRWVGADENVVFNPDGMKGSDAEMVKRIQRARGQRS